MPAAYIHVGVAISPSAPVGGYMYAYSYAVFCILRELENERCGWFANKCVCLVIFGSESYALQ